MRAGGWRAVLALPFNVLGVIPVLLLLATRNGRFAWELAGPGRATFWLALPCFAAGLLLMARTIGLFDRVGEGTLAPWQPPRHLVVEGIYRHVRNPMISGVLLNLVGESLLFRSPALLGWFALFFAVNAIYLPLSEEPGLEARFGDEYRRYKQAVPRWVPRLRPWQPESPPR